MVVKTRGFTVRGPHKQANWNAEKIHLACVDFDPIESRLKGGARSWKLVLVQPSVVSLDLGKGLVVLTWTISDCPLARTSWQVEAIEGRGRCGCDEPGPKVASKSLTRRTT